jgi:hypothetical protein
MITPGAGSVGWERCSIARETRPLWTHALCRGTGATLAPWLPDSVVNGRFCGLLLWLRQLLDTHEIEIPIEDDLHVEAVG